MSEIAEKIKVDALGVSYDSYPNCPCCQNNKLVGRNIAAKNTNLGWKELIAIPDWHCYGCNCDFDE